MGSMARSLGRLITRLIIKVVIIRVVRATRREGLMRPILLMGSTRSSCSITPLSPFTNWAFTQLELVSS